LITDTVLPEHVTPVRSRRHGGAVGRWFAKEGTLVVFVGLAISAIFNWRIVLHPKGVVMGDIGDPLLQAWELAWNQHLFSSGDFWTANMFYPAKDNFAFTDSLLGYLPLSMFGDGTYAAIVRYNMAYVLAFAIAFIGCYLLARQLGGTWQAAALAGVVFAWAPWRLSHTSHMNILSTGGIALALFALARGHGYSFRFGLRPGSAKPWWAFAGWLIAAWQVTIGFATGLPFIYLMAGVGLVIAVVNVVKRRQLGARLLVANGVGVVVFLGITYLITVPYLRVIDEYHFTRSLAELQIFSPPPLGLVTAPDFSWLWRGTFLNSTTKLVGPGVGEQLLFPGLIVLLLALVGLVVSVWPVRVRVGLAIGSVAVMILALGTTFFGGEYTYLLVSENLPGWNALRTPGRLILWAILLLALLAAGAVSRIAQILAKRARSRPSPQRRRILALLLLLPAVGALAEGIPDRTYAAVPGIPSDLSQLFTQTRDPLLILPAGAVMDELKYLWWSTEGFPLMANGNSGNFPPHYQKIVDASVDFPSNYSIAVLAKYGIQKVVVLKSAAASTPFAAALTRPTAQLPVTRTETGDLVVFTLR
jgi:hypothetical protein